MTRFLLWVLAGLLGAVVVHIATILLWPTFRGDERAIEMPGLDSAFVPISTAELAAITGTEPDPAMAYAICRFTLAGGPVRVVSAPAATFWSAAVFDQNGRNVFSVNDRTDAEPNLDLFLTRPADLDRLTRDPPAVLEEVVVVELSIEAGFVMVRAFVPDPTQRARVAMSLEEGDCAAPIEPEPVPDLPSAPAPAETPD